MKSIRKRDRDVILATAILNVSDKWNLGQKKISKILGISESTVSRVFNKKCPISLSTNEGERALYLIKIFCSLDSYLKGSFEQQKDWINSYNHLFQMTPLNKMESIDGLVRLLDYLDLIRGKY